MNFNLFKSNLFKDEQIFSIETLQIENANAFEINANNNSTIINNNDTKDNAKNMLFNFLKEKLVSEKKNSNKEIQDQQGGIGEEDYDNTLNLNNKTLQNTTLSSSSSSSSTTTKQSSNSIDGFNFAAAGDWACTSKTKATVENIIDHNAELVLALGDLSYDSGAKCWLKIIKPIADKTKIAIGNHEAESSKKLKDYMKAFNLEKQYYSFNYKNVHFLALSTETSYDKGSKQYKFAVKDLEQNAGNSAIDWIIVFYHRNAYSSGGGLPDETSFRKTYHPLFDKYNVDLALQGHHHAYERMYPITFNDDNKNKPIVNIKDKVKGSNVFQNPDGTIFLTVGTGGAESMPVGKSKPFSAAKEDGIFGIINIDIEKEDSDKNILTGTFINNKKKHKILDEFKIIKG
jgi:hypothetical protein